MSTDEWPYNGDLIRDLRQQRGFSQADLARALGEAGLKTYPTTIHRIESEQTGLSLIFAARLAAVLGCAVSDLLKDPPDGLTFAELDRSAAYENGRRQGLRDARDLIDQSLGERRSPVRAPEIDYDRLAACLSGLQVSSEDRTIWSG